MSLSNYSLFCLPILPQKGSCVAILLTIRRLSHTGQRLHLQLYPLTSLVAAIIITAAGGKKRSLLGVVFIFSFAHFLIVTREQTGRLLRALLLFTLQTLRHELVHNSLETSRDCSAMNKHTHHRLAGAAPIIIIVSTP